jgi:hypothetical protein
VEFVVQLNNHQVSSERTMHQATHEEEASNCYRTVGFIAKHSALTLEGLKLLILKR